VVPWVAGISPDVEWCRVPPAGPYPTREEAIAAIAADALAYRPDRYGAQPRPWVAYVVREGLYGWEPQGCACYGRHECAACQLARDYLTPLEIRAAARNRGVSV